MYGMVNRALMDLVTATGGPGAWEQVCKRAGLATQNFSNTTVYDDAITYDLVAATAEELGQEPATVLEQFGRHWILFTGREGWGPLVDMAGDCVEEFVEELDAMHARVQASMPECLMPSFSVSRVDDGELVVEYRSERPGLAPMALGLLNGLAERFDEEWDISHVGQTSNSDAEVFSLRPIPVGARADKCVGSA